MKHVCIKKLPFGLTDVLYFNFIFYLIRKQFLKLWAKKLSRDALKDTTGPSLHSKLAVKCVLSKNEPKKEIKYIELWWVYIFANTSSLGNVLFRQWPNWFRQNFYNAWTKWELLHWQQQRAKRSYSESFGIFVSTHWKKNWAGQYSSQTMETSCIFTYRLSCYSIFLQ